MNTILIDRNSVKPNPKYGMNYLLGEVEIKIEYYGLIPKKFTEYFLEIESNNSGHGIIKGVAKLIKKPSPAILTELTDWKQLCHVARNNNYIEYWDNVAWLYEYLDREIKCTNCNELIMSNEIETDYGDWTEYNICPKCNTCDSFEIEYEDFKSNMYINANTSK